MSRPAQKDAPSTLQRAFAILDVFTPSRSELSIRELSRLSGVSRSATHRYVRELVEWGALESGEGGVRLGVKLFELGTMAPTRATLRDAALPFAHDLHEATGMTVNIAVREGSEIVYLEKIRARTLVVPHTRWGGRAPLHATALGKAILASSPAPLVDEILAGPLERSTDRTVTDPAALRSELTTIRRTGVAYDLEESRLGLFCVAAVVLGPRHLPLGAISATGATARAQLRRLAPLVQATALAVAASLRGPVARESFTARESGQLPRMSYD